jgi:hypothetical protein
MLARKPRSVFSRSVIEERALPLDRDALNGLCALGITERVESCDVLPNVWEGDA